GELVGHRGVVGEPRPGAAQLRRHEHTEQAGPAQVLKVVHRELAGRVVRGGPRRESGREPRRRRHQVTHPSWPPSTRRRRERPTPGTARRSAGWAPWGPGRGGSLASAAADRWPVAARAPGPRRRTGRTGPPGG